jgi:hypothetical protein
MTSKKFYPVFHEMGADEQPLVVEGSTETWLHVVEVVTSDWTPHMVDLWGMCSTCEETVRVESHSHNHVCELNDTDGCGWIDPDHIGDQIGNDLIPPVSIGDWDYSLYIVDADHGGANFGKRTHRVNDVIVYTDKFEQLPEVRPHEPDAAWELPYSCAYCKRRFASRLYWASFHTCQGWAEAKAMLRASKAEPDFRRAARPVVLREAALTENWSEADRNRVPSELGKLNWMNPRQD